MKALPVSVYRDARRGDYDCTNNGVSSRFRELLVICPDGFIDVDENNPPENLCKVVKRHLFGRDVYHVEPVARPKGAGWMMGGNYAATSDSRFHALCGDLYAAIPVHDRQESWEEYDILSR